MSQAMVSKGFGLWQKNHNIVIELRSTENCRSQQPKNWTNSNHICVPNSHTIYQKSTARDTAQNLDNYRKENQTRILFCTTNKYSQ